MERIGEQVQQHPADLLGYDINFANSVVKVGFQGSVEGFVLCTKAVVGQAEVFICQGVEVRGFLFAIAAAAVLQHPFDDAVGPLAMVVIIFSGFPSGHCNECIHFLDIVFI